MKKTAFIILLVLAAVILVSCEKKEGGVQTDDTIQTVYDASSSETDEESAQVTEADTSFLEDSTEAEEVPAEAQCSITSFVVSAGKNRNMYSDIVGVIADGVITLTVSDPTDTYSLKCASVDVESDAASYSFSNGDGNTVDLTDSALKCTLTDTEGRTKEYSVVLEYSDGILPVICINTAGGAAVTTKEYYIDATVSIDTAGVDGWYLPEGFTSMEETPVGIKGRGNSTWGWAKKPYKIKFDSKESVLGMESAKKWVLLANYSDYSLMRNYVAFEGAKVLSTTLSPFSQYPVNLFLNGEYVGVYSIGEDKEVKEGRIELAEDNGTADTSYLLEIGGTEEDDIVGVTCFHTGLIRFCSIEYPEDNLNAEKAAFISDYCAKADEAVRNHTNWQDYIDIDSLVDWFIQNELFYNLESCFRRSCFITKEPGGKLKMGPIWDYDLAMGNLYNDFGQYESWSCMTQGNGYIEDNWYCYLLKDEAFLTRLRSRWAEVKDELLSTTLGCIDKMSVTLANSAECNFEVWNILGTRAVPPQPTLITGLKTYEDNVAYLRSFIVSRWNWMDKNI